MRHARRLAVPFLAGLSMLVSGCGFAPLYAENTGVAAELSGIQVESGEGRAAYILRQELIKQLAGSPGAETRYTLETAIEEQRRGFGIRIDEVTTRYELAVTVQYRLRRLSDGAIVYAGKSTGASSFDVPVEAYAEIAAEERARARAAEMAAEAIRTDLAFYFSSARDT